MIGPNDDILNYLDDYLHELLTPEDAETVRRFCETPQGRAALDEAERRNRALQSLPPVEASDALIRQTVQHVAVKETAGATLRRILKPAVLLATAASVLIIGSLHLYYYRLAPSPYDLRLLGQRHLLSGSSASLRVAVVDRTSGQPIGGVPIRLALYNRGTQEEQELAALTTDPRGGASPQFRLPDWDAGPYELRVTARVANREEAFSQPLDLKRDWRLMLTTDKPVYQPGQTIHIRSQGLKKPDLKPVAGQQATFTLTDPKGNVIFKRQDVTSRFGIASADCPLADEIMEGPYQIRCTVGTTTSEATVTNHLPQAAPMVILDLPLPGGFALDAGELDELVGSQQIARYQITPRQAIVYLRQLEPGQSLELRYRLRATMPVKVTVPAAEAYEYYDPSRSGSGGATRLEAFSA